MAGKFLGVAAGQWTDVLVRAGGQTPYGGWKADAPALHSDGAKGLGWQSALVSLQAKASPPPPYGGGSEAE